MELKIAKNTLTKSKALAKISCEEVLEKVQNGVHIFYFDRENAHKDIQKACNSFKKAGYSVHLHEVHYGLDTQSYIYELHII